MVRWRGVLLGTALAVFVAGASSCGEVSLDATEHCQDGICPCPPPYARCKESCVDVSTDRENCGACGVRCAEGLSCHESQCECGPGKTLCLGRCADTRRDPENCGTCGVICMTPSACMDGVCM